MKYIRNSSTDPYFNLALEEYVLNTFTDDDYLLLWQNDRTIVIGKHQNAVEEVNTKRAGELEVTVVRRNTGGGAVYHDMGNLNFSFITDWLPDVNMDYDTFLKPVIRALREFGVHAEKQGRNDLVVDGRKISGNAQCIKNTTSRPFIPNSQKGRILHHGTLLVSSELSLMPELLNVKTDKIVSKGIKSIRSRVANISEYAKEPIDIELLKEALIQSFFEGSERNEHTLDETQAAEIEKLRAEKYSTWEWNFGVSADYSYKNGKRFPGGSVEVRLDVKNGIIERCKIFGDFLALVGVEALETAVVGCRSGTDDIKKALEVFDIRRFYGVSLEELLECFEL